MLSVRAMARLACPWLYSVKIVARIFSSSILNLFLDGIEQMVDVTAQSGGDTA